jgi:hypothetical protein
MLLRGESRKWRNPGGSRMWWYFAERLFALWKTAAGEGEEERVGPFSERKLAANTAAGASWDYQQALRKAQSLMREGKDAEAIKLLEQLLARSPDEQERAKIRQVIENLKTREKRTS